MGYVSFVKYYRGEKIMYTGVRRWGVLSILLFNSCFQETLRRVNQLHINLELEKKMKLLVCSDRGR